MRAHEQDAGVPAWDFRLLELPLGLGPAQLAEAVRALASAHDLCRLRQDATGAVIAGAFAPSFATPASLAIARSDVPA